MATADPLDDLLNAVVDGHEISALVGTLESQLASPTNQEPPSQNSTTSINSNHVGGGERQTALVGEGVQTGQKPGLIHNNSQIAVNASNGSKDIISQAPILGLNSVVNSGSHALNSSVAVSLAPNVNHSALHTHNGNVVPLKLNTISNAAITSQTGSQPVIVSIGSSVGQVTGNGSSGSAIYNLASVAAEQQPLSVPHNAQLQPRTVREQLERQEKDRISGGSPVPTLKAQFVVKQEPKVQVRPTGHIVTVSSAVPQSQNVELASIKPGTPIAKTVNSMTNPITPVANAQGVATVRPPTSQNIQVISVNPGQPRMAGTASQQRTIAPRVITSTTPIRIAAAPNQPIVAPRAPVSTVTLSRNVLP